MKINKRNVIARWIRTMKGDTDTGCCIVDSANTFVRECYMDGELLCHYAPELVEDKGFVRNRMAWFANVGKWETGRLIGDPKAATKEKIASEWRKK